MKIIKTSLLMAGLAMSFTAAAEYRMNVSSVNDGAWISVSENGKGVEGATVTTNIHGIRSEKTDEYGRVFVSLPQIRSQTVKFTATDDSTGQSLTKVTYIQRDK
ncbi:hypothetical protein [Photobacterium sanguinicancri]|uniref:Uncharacterized protein n=1 Tax=Photobacterium sanguinicancri TaxID=875932 RepID=A0AAW7Y136_9GAMM|nr:hypothetical protein [Photobacterium sanguinicancri]KXI24487.1 hypothetical protein AS132_00435 [Photobacterium sanguinicancri]MDO6498045.1 hypothetical protein [Photobacterium sanguinicancri]MDO6541972.1 hypothetical protein [Photobacterium sanguinicancri]OZS42145.1 hypothetical protein ASV53_19930 [Photobacterium sanguinicancri]